MHKALIHPGGKRMRAQRGHGAFRRNSGMADAMAGRHAAQAETRGHILRQADFLLDLHAYARAHHPDVLLRHEGAGSGLGACGQRHHGMGVDHPDMGRLARAASSPLKVRAGVSDCTVIFSPVPSSP